MNVLKIKHETSIINTLNQIHISDPKYSAYMVRNVLKHCPKCPKTLSKVFPIHGPKYPQTWSEMSMRHLADDGLPKYRTLVSIKNMNHKTDKLFQLDRWKLFPVRL